MEQTMERIDPTYAYDTSTYSIAIIEVPNLSLVSVDIGDTQPSTTTTIGFFTRDPIGFEDGLNLYRSYFVLSRMDPSGEACLVYLDCFLSGTERLDWKTTRCNYSCVIDTTRGGKNGDPPGTRDVPGVGAVDCRDPRLGNISHVMSYNTHVCSCAKSWETQTAYDDWVNPVRDCKRSECKAAIAGQVARLRQTCKGFGAGPFKIACEALARSIEAGADEVCNLCDKR